MLRIDTHHHMIPPDYRKALEKAGIAHAGGAALPEWSIEKSLEAMDELGIGTAILSVSAPGTAFLPDPADAAALARDLNDFAAKAVAAQPDRFGFFATVPLPHVDAATAETLRALDDLKADGVVLLANHAGVYLGEEGQDALFAALDERAAVAFVHPAELPARQFRRCAVGRGLPTRHDPCRIFVSAQRNTAALPEHQVHPQPRRRIRSLRQPPDDACARE